MDFLIPSKACQCLPRLTEFSAADHIILYTLQNQMFSDVTDEHLVKAIFQYVLIKAE